MNLREISVCTVYNHQFQKEFNNEAWCVQEMYWSYLKKYNTKKTLKVVLTLNDDLKAKYDLEYLGGVIIANEYFNFEKYFKIDPYNKKRSILEVLHQKMKHLASIEGWEIGPLEKACENCLANNLEHKWLFKNKYILSEDKDHYGGFECLWDLDRFQVDGIILNKDKKGIKRECILSLEPHEGEFVYYADFKWDRNNRLVLKSKEGESWSISV